MDRLCTCMTGCTGKYILYNHTTKTSQTRAFKIQKVNKHSLTTHTSHFGVVGHSDTTFVVVCLHGNLSSTSGPMPEDIQQRTGLQFTSIQIE